MLETLFAAITPGLVVGLMLFYWERKQKKRDKRANEVADAQAKGNLLRLDLEVATAQLSYAVAMAYKRGHANGEMESAIGKYEETMERFREFERSRVVHAAED